MDLVPVFFSPINNSSKFFIISPQRSESRHDYLRISHHYTTTAVSAIRRRTSGDNYARACCRPALSGPFRCRDRQAQAPVCISRKDWSRLPNEIVFRNVGRDRLPVHDLRCGLIGGGVLFYCSVLLPCDERVMDSLSGGALGFP